MSTEPIQKPVDTKENGTSQVDSECKEISKELAKATLNDQSDNVTKEEVTSDQKAESKQADIETLDRMPNTGHLVKVNDKILHYERVGTGKIPVLLMPGLMGSSRSDFPEQLGSLK